MRLDSYFDTQDPPHCAIGYGHDESNPRPVRGLLKGVFYEGKVCPDLKITQAEAERVFEEDAADTEWAITDAINDSIELAQHQFDALFDFVHHYGPGHFHGSTLLQKINFNPTNLKEILPQFARWSINAGKTDKAMYMRSCRRACIYAGVPVPQMLWQPRDFPWKTRAGLKDPIYHDIDLNFTPDVFFLVELGRKKAEPFKFDPNRQPSIVREVEAAANRARGSALSYSDPETHAKASTESASKPGDSPATQPAPSVQTQSKDSAGGVADDAHILFEEASTNGQNPDVEAVRPAEALNQPQPAPASPAPPQSGIDQPPGPSPKAAGPARVDAQEAGASGVSRSSPPTVQKPPSKNSVPITDAPYKIDPSFGLKPMEESERWQASIAQNSGMVIMRGARYGWFGSIPATIASFVEKDPIFSAMFLATVGIAGIWALGYVRKQYGDWCRHHAERKASQAMV